MDSEGNPSWIAKLCGGFDTLCTEAKDMLPQEPMGHVRDQFLTAGESLKQFYSDMAKDVLPAFSQDSPRGNGPASAKREEYTALPLDNKTTISCDDGQEGISEAAKSLSRAFCAAAGGEVHTALVPKREGEFSIGRSDFEVLGLEEFKSGPSSGGIQHDARVKLSTSVKSSVVGSYAGADTISESKFSPATQGFKVTSSGAIEYDARAESSASLQPLVPHPYGDIDDTTNILDSKFSAEDYEVPDDESSEATYSIHKDSFWLGSELQAELIRLGFLGPDSGSNQSLEVDSSEETEESDDSTESECSSEAYASTVATSSVSSISTRTTLSDSFLLGRELQAELERLGFLGPDSESVKSLEVDPSEETEESGDSTESECSSEDTSTDDRLTSSVRADAYSDILDHSNSGEKLHCDDGVAGSIEEPKLNDSIIQQETDELPLLDMNFVDERSMETGSQGSPNAETNQGNAEAEKEWERLDEDFSDSDWEII